jgi:hypothetical protein
MEAVSGTQALALIARAGAGKAPELETMQAYPREH